LVIENKHTKTILKKVVFGFSQTVICIRDSVTISVGDRLAQEKPLLKFGARPDLLQRCVAAEQAPKVTPVAMLKNVFV
jgi:hypothetical protein